MRVVIRTHYVTDQQGPRGGDWWMSQAIDIMLGSKLRVLRKMVLCNQ
jgi:phage gp46-like protein